MVSVSRRTRIRRRERLRTPAVIGAGIDLVDVDRIEARLARSRRLAGAVFTRRERDYGRARRRPARHLAAAFAAKEAFLKAVGIGLWSGVPLRQVEVVRRRSGRPVLVLGPRARRALASRGGRRALVSMSHAGRFALAVVLVQP